MSCRQVYARISYIRQRGLVKLVSGGLAGLAHKCRIAALRSGVQGHLPKQSGLSILIRGPSLYQ